MVVQLFLHVFFHICPGHFAQKPKALCPFSCYFHSKTCEVQQSQLWCVLLRFALVSVSAPGQSVTMTLIVPLDTDVMSVGQQQPVQHPVLTHQLAFVFGISVSAARMIPSVPMEEVAFKTD